LGVFDTTTISFTPTHGFSGTPPKVTITLRAKGVAPLVNLDSSQANAGNARIGTSGSANVGVKNSGDGGQARSFACGASTP